MRLWNSRMMLGLGLVAVAAAAGCGQSEPSVDAGGSGSAVDSVMGCDAGAEAIADLLGEGIPTYDYDPFVDLTEMIDGSDEIITGTLLTAQRVPFDFNDGSDDGMVTRVQPAEGTAIKSNSGHFLKPFDYVSGWGDRDSVDPLADPVLFDLAMLRFIAFLNGDGDSFSPHIQGFAVSCGHDEPAVPVFETLPGAAGMTIDEITGEVLAITDPPPPTANVMTIPHRLLAEDLDYGEAYTTRQLTNEDVWAVAPDAELDDPPSGALFEFNVPESSSCPNGPLDHIEYNPDTGRIYPVLDPVEHDGDCTSDAEPHVIIVAIVREDLPDAPFSLWVGPGDPPDGIPDDNIATFDRGELRAPSGGDLEHPLLSESDPLEVGATGIILDVDLHCGLERLYHLVADQQWVLTDDSAATGIPASWDAVSRGENIDLVVERVDEDQLVVTARGTTDSVDYRPADDLEGCD